MIVLIDGFENQFLNSTHYVSDQRETMQKKINIDTYMSKWPLLQI
jgi:hypothetical protein